MVVLVEDEADSRSDLGCRVRLSTVDSNNVATGCMFRSGCSILQGGEVSSPATTSSNVVVVFTFQAEEDGTLKLSHPTSPAMILGHLRTASPRSPHFQNLPARPAHCEATKIRDSSNIMRLRTTRTMQVTQSHLTTMIQPGSNVNSYRLGISQFARGSIRTNATSSCSHSGTSNRE